MSATPTGKAFENTTMAVYLRKRVDELASRKSQREIALQAGYEKPNILSMFKRGETKVPFDKVPALANALECDPVFFMRLQMEQPGGFDPKTISTMLGRMATLNEHSILIALRKVNEGKDVDLAKAEIDELAEAYSAILNKRASAKKVAASA